MPNWCRRDCGTASRTDRFFVIVRRAAILLLLPLAVVSQAELSHSIRNKVVQGHDNDVCAASIKNSPRARQKPGGGASHAPNADNGAEPLPAASSSLLRKPRSHTTCTTSPRLPFFQFDGDAFHAPQFHTECHGRPPVALTRVAAGQTNQVRGTRSGSTELSQDQRHTQTMEGADW